jgi:hypothetical protein
MPNYLVIKTSERIQADINKPPTNEQSIQHRHEQSHKNNKRSVNKHCENNRRSGDGRKSLIHDKKSSE